MARSKEELARCAMAATEILQTLKDQFPETADAELVISSIIASYCLSTSGAPDEEVILRISNFALVLAQGKRP